MGAPDSLASALTCLSTEVRTAGLRPGRENALLDMIREAVAESKVCMSVYVCVCVCMCVYVCARSEAT